jgi:large subunit ribosomal protein L41
MVFTPTASLGRALRRLALTTKQAGKDYYKGTGSGSMGRHTKYGGYRIDWDKVRTYKVPDLTDFHVCLASTISPWPSSNTLDS